MASSRRFVDRRLLLAALAGATAVLASGCGFALRRAASIPFDTLYLSAPPHSEPGEEIRSAVLATDATRLVTDQSGAAARLEIVRETREKEIVGFSASGRPREYQLRLRVSFRITAGSTREVGPATELVLHRDMTTTDVQLLSKEQEEEILYHDMQSDVARQMLRRLAALRP